MLVNQHFYSPAALPEFNETAALAAGQMPDLKGAAPGVVDDAVSFVLGSLHASHTGRYHAGCRWTTTNLPMSSVSRSAATCAGCSRRTAR